MYTNDTDSSFSQKDLDSLINEYELKNDNVSIHVEEYTINNSSNRRYIAEFEYQGAQYQLMGRMEKKEFDNILKNLFFV